MTQKAKIEVFTSPTCPHCPNAKRIAEEIANDRDDVKVVETSTYSKKGQKRAKSLQVRSVPTLFITGPEYEGRIGYVGTPSKDRLSQMVNIALGLEDWPEKKPGLVSSLLNKIKIKI